MFGLIFIAAAVAFLFLFALALARAAKDIFEIEETDDD